MNRLFIAVSLILLLTASLISQTKQLMFIKDADFSFYSMQRVRYQNTGEVKLEKQLVEIDGVTTMRFNGEDSLTLLNADGISASTSLSGIKDVTQYRTRLNPVLGITMGVIGGAIIGAVIGSAVSVNEDPEFFPELKPGVNKLSGGLVGALIGALGGGLIGTLIVSAINNVTLDMFSVPDKEKKAKLIEFLSEKRMKRNN
jgi:hypothetical protein